LTAIAAGTGDAGTVYLCHPFLVHASQPHQGYCPRFLAQPPLLPVDPDNRPHEISIPWSRRPHGRSGAYSERR